MAWKTTNVALETSGDPAPTLATTMAKIKNAASETAGLVVPAVAKTSVVAAPIFVADVELLPEEVSLETRRSKCTNVEGAALPRHDRRRVSEAGGDEERLTRVRALAATTVGRPAQSTAPVGRVGVKT